MKKLSKFLAIIPAILMLVSIIPITASATDPTSGTCGDNLTWSYDSTTQTLTISGTGDMYDFKSNKRPWEAYEEKALKVLVEDGVTSVGVFAFYTFKYIEEVELADSITSIGHYAFGYCYELTSIDLPDSLTNIGGYAFYNCDFLSITIPNGVTEIKSYTFNGCTELENVYYDGTEKQWNSITIEDFNDPLRHAIIHYNDGYNSAIRGTCGDNLIWNYDEKTCTLTISGTGDMYDYKSNNRPWGRHQNYILKVIVEDGVTSIGNLAFYQCYEILEVELADSITSIGNSAFSYCFELTSVELPENLINIGNSAFNSTLDTAVELPQNVKKIGDYAFDGCNLKGVILNDGLESIGAYAFDGQDELTEIIIPESVTTIGEYAFNYCSNLTSINIPKKLTEISAGLFANCEKLSIDIVIPEGIITIGESAFYRCLKVPSISLPNSIEEIGASAFKACTALKNIVIPANVTTISDSLFHSSGIENVTFLGNITSIGKSAFAHCDELKEFTFQSSVKTVGEMAFYSSGLEKITIPATIQTFGDGVFSNCDKLDSVTISNGITQIPAKMFENCTALKAIQLPKTVTSIGTRAFNGCSELELVIIPVSVNTIGSNAFKNCTDMEEVYYGGTQAQWEAIVTTPSFENVIIHYNSENAHIHEYKTVVIAPTCDEQGYTIYSCTLCSYEKNDDYVDAVGCTVENWNVTTQPTCYTYGSRNGICSVCGKAITERMETLKHVWSELKVDFEPTCKDGQKSRECLLCGDKSDIQTIPATGHVYGEWHQVTEGACREYARFEQYCTVCGSVNVMDAPIEHKYNSTIVTPPTCTEKGYTTHICIACGDSYVDEYVNAKGHRFTTEVITPATHTTEGVRKYTCDCGHTFTRTISKLTEHTYEITITPPTCTEQGYTTRICECGKTIVDDYVDALGHTPATEIEEEFVAPTCTEQGYIIYECSTCGDSYKEYISETGHSYDWEIITPPTCYTYGSRKGVCCACGHEITETLDNLSHNWSKLKVDFEPTCTEDGQKSKECSRCGDKTAIEKIPAVGHTYGEWKQVTEAACKEYAKFEQYCINCNRVNTMFAPVEHKYELVITAPTCTEQGYTSYTCRCGDSYIVEYVDIDENNHHHTSEITTPATHTTTGIMTYTCACGDSYTEVIAKIEKHNYESVVTAPTCTERGYTTYTCECGDSYVDDYIDATGHSFDDWVVTKKPTTDTEGEMKRVCPCGEKEYKSIDKLPPVEDNDIEQENTNKENVERPEIPNTDYSIKSSTNIQFAVAIFVCVIFCAILFRKKIYIFVSGVEK